MGRPSWLVGPACLALSVDMLPNMPHSRMPPTPPLRPSHPWPGVARGQDPRVKGRVLPDSPKSAPLTGGRFRRPAKTHEGTPSGAHFSHRCRVWRPAGGPRECRGAGRVYGSPPRMTGCGRVGPIRVRCRRCATGPRRRRCAGGRAGRRRANRRPSDTARAARPMTGHRAELVADVPPGVGLVWEGTRRPSTMKRIGEHICGIWRGHRGGSGCLRRGIASMMA